jgi:hypothetical protein
LSSGDLLMIGEPAMITLASRKRTPLKSTSVLSNVR